MEKCVICQKVVLERDQQHNIVVAQPHTHNADHAEQSRVQTAQPKRNAQCADSTAKAEYVANRTYSPLPSFLFPTRFFTRSKRTPVIQA
jgi:hypothetical protein